MESKISKPRFEEIVAVTTMNLPDEGLIFNSQRVGPTDFKGLRKADYGKGFRMPTMPEVVPLVYASLENRENYKTAKNVVKTIKNHWISGNTGILYIPKGMFVQDNPELKNGKVSMNHKALESKLGSYEEKGVVFSDDKTIRFTPYNYKRESQTALELSKNAGVMALVGGEENAEKLAKSSEHFKIDPYFYALENVGSPEIRVADLFSSDFDSRLSVIADSCEYFDSRYSFGVLENASEAGAQKFAKKKDVFYSVEDVLTESGNTNDFAPNQIKKLQNIIEQKNYQIRKRE